MPGKVDEAFAFDGGSDGTDDFVSVPDDPVWTFGNDPFSIDLWVNFTEVRHRSPFVSHDEGGGELAKWIFWFDAQGHEPPFGPALRFHINSPTLGPLDPAIAPWDPVAGRWYHVAITRSGSEYSLFIDGGLVTVRTDSHIIPDANVAFMIGRAESFLFAGLIDEVEVFDRALEPSEIQSIFEAGGAGKCKPPPGSECTITGTPGDDRLVGTSGRDVICGLGGDDHIKGLRSDDVILAGPGADVVVGGVGGDRLQGGSGPDYLRGDFPNHRPGADVLRGDTGADRLVAADGASGNDTADGGEGTDACSADAGDVVIGCP